MSKRYIDAEEAEKNIRKCLDIQPPELVPSICKKVEDIAVDAVRLTPTADVAEVRHGEWKEHGRYTRGNIQWIGLICSECHFSIAKKVNLDDETTMIDNYLYCPGCGVKMDGDTRDIDAFIEQIESCSYSVTKGTDDVVEVVRCKDCKYFQPCFVMTDDGERRPYTEEEIRNGKIVSGDVGINCGSRCERYGYWEENRFPVWYQENDYCSYGERREENEG